MEPSAGRRSSENDEAALQELERRLGYRFRDRALLVRALTHRSFANERGQQAPDNEVLEFLGDAVLGLIVSDLLCKRHPYFSEGQVSKLKSFLVSASTLSMLGEKLGLGEFVLLGRGEEKSAGRGKGSILANTFEAIIAALYSDGGLECAEQFVVQRIEPLIEEVDEETPHPVHDFKSALQEQVQASGLAVPVYRVIEEEGPDHAKRFHVEVSVAGRCVGRGRGRAKKRAEQEAARQAIEALAGRGTPATGLVLTAETDSDLSDP